jgi:hypothetical protein
MSANCIARVMSVGDTMPTTVSASHARMRPSPPVALLRSTSRISSSGPAIVSAVTGQAICSTRVLARRAGGTERSRPRVTRPASRPVSSRTGNVEQWRGEHVVVQYLVHGHVVAHRDRVGAHEVAGRASWRDRGSGGSASPRREMRSARTNRAARTRARTRRRRKGTRRTPVLLGRTRTPARRGPRRARRGCDRRFGASGSRAGPVRRRPARRARC